MQLSSASRPTRQAPAVPAGVRFGENTRTGESSSDNGQPEPSGQTGGKPNLLVRLLSAPFRMIGGFFRALGRILSGGKAPAQGRQTRTEEPVSVAVSGSAPGTIESFYGITNHMPENPDGHTATIHHLPQVIGSRYRIGEYVEFLNSQHPQALTHATMPIGDIQPFAQSIGIPLDKDFIEHLFDGDEAQFVTFFNKTSKSTYGGATSEASLGEMLEVLDKLMRRQAKKMPLDISG